ncbi:MAG TPA: MFS transporter, partial [Planctomycetota bacterium]|nr:MFS transporter [Planctomycetota bacterium]
IATGLFGGPLGSTMNAYVGDLFEGDDRTKAVGYFSLGFPVAVVVAVPIGSAVGGEYGWQTVCFTLAILSAFMAVGTFRFPHVHIPRQEKGIFAEYGEMLGVIFHPRGWPFFISFLLIMSTFFGYVINIAIWFENNQGLENHGTNSLSWAYLCGGLGSILGALTFRVLVKHFGKVEMLVGSALVSGVMVYLLVSRPPGTSHVLLFTLFFFSHFSGSLRRPLAGLIAVDISPPEVRGRFLAMLNITFSLSFAVAAGWTSLVLVYPDPKTGIKNMEHMDWMALCIIAGTLAAVPSLLRVRADMKRLAAERDFAAPAIDQTPPGEAVGVIDSEE